MIRPSLDKTSYALRKNKKPNISYFKVFGSKCFILNTKDNLGNFDAKYNVGIFFGYSSTSKTYRVFNKKIMIVEESIHIVFDESKDSPWEDYKLKIRFINKKKRLIQRMKKNHL